MSLILESKLYLLDLQLEHDYQGKLYTQLCGEHDQFDFTITNILSLPAFGVYIFKTYFIFTRLLTFSDILMTDAFVIWPDCITLPFLETMES